MAWMHGVTTYQWLVLFVAWLGWVFDAMDATIYAIVLHPALHELLQAGATGGEVTSEQIGWYGGIVFSVFLIGWALGGIGFGMAADYFGRTKTLIATILIYAVFTGLAALAQEWWHLAIYRFLTALGVGGEWAAGAAIVAETWPEEKRSRAAGILQSAWAFGFFIAAGCNLLLKDSGWRMLFLIGILPAFVALLVRRWVKEPERWVQAHEREPRSAHTSWLHLVELFRPSLRRDTLIGSTLAFVAVFGVWGATNWAPTLIRGMPDLQGQDSAALAEKVSYAIMALNAGALFGYLGFGPLAERFGRRPVFGLMCLGSLILLPATYFVPHSYAEVLLLLPVLGFFNNGIFSGFPIYLPELYPTRLRATGSGFCFNAGRILASAAPFVTGWLVTMLGSFNNAASTIALIYLLGLAILPFATETKGRPLPE
ncbi:MAG: MFS transporter [Nitrospira sp.]|nr:MFS transporter [Nitrospira sp.]MBX3341863.1 MFS transporter [Nitrospira sp.]MBX3372093.1 MFS transporter [Nitrospira sp.]MBX7039687.1 MFS transporter [Nitrospira sp.]MCW5795520.1 MFS transporter [Nitrospira sp.]